MNNDERAFVCVLPGIDLLAVALFTKNFLNVGWEFRENFPVYLRIAENPCLIKM